MRGGALRAAAVRSRAPVPRLGAELFDELEDDRQVGSARVDIVVSAPLVLEYEDAHLRQLGTTKLDQDDVESIVETMFAMSRSDPAGHLLWRPQLRDPGDDLVLEIAVAADCGAIVTHNVRDFSGAERFGIQILTPSAFLAELRRKR